MSSEIKIKAFSVEKGDHITTVHKKLIYQKSSIMNCPICSKPYFIAATDEIQDVNENTKLFTVCRNEECKRYNIHIIQLTTLKVMNRNLSPFNELPIVHKDPEGKKLLYKHGDAQIRKYLRDSGYKP